MALEWVADITFLSILANMGCLSHSATVNESLLFAFEPIRAFCWVMWFGVWATAFHFCGLFVFRGDTKGVDLSEAAGN